MEVLYAMDVEVVMEGKVPRYRLHGPAAVYEAKLSLSHTHEHAIAFVVAMG